MNIDQKTIFLRTLFICFLGIFGLIAQNKDTLSPHTARTYDQQFELREDNDFLHFTDRYYSTGTYLGLRKLLTPQKDSTENRHYSFYLFQEIYTPSLLDGTNNKSFERPYAGFLGITNELSLANRKRFMEFKLLMGITGPWSGAEKLQAAFHSTAATDSKIATWTEQLENSFHLNLYYNYVWELQWQPNPFSVHFAISPSAALGTRDAFVQNDVVFYFGQRNALNETMAYKQIGNLDRELFFALRFGYRYLFHDAMIEGNWLKDDSPFTVEPYHQLLLYSFETFYRKGRNDFKLTYNFETPRTPKAATHLYISLTYARSY